MPRPRALSLRASATLPPRARIAEAATFQTSPSYSSTLGSALQSGPISGTFTLTLPANQRGTLAMSSGRLAGSGNGVFYITADTEVVVLGTDPTNVEPQVIFFDE